MKVRITLLLIVVAAIVGAVLVPHRSRASAAVDSASRKPSRAGWTVVELTGTPRQIGYQHGWLLAREIEDLRAVTESELTHDTGKSYSFFRDAAERLLWPRIEQEYRDELNGIIDGARAQGAKLDILDLVVVNANMELSPYYLTWYDQENNITPPKSAVAPEHCSAFVATGKYTRDGRIVIAHNDWTGYMDGSRWNIIFDIRPEKGHRIIMDGLPGFIHSGDDFGVNSAGLAITETTITKFKGFDPNGIPEFVRARKAMQYASTIDDFARIMKGGNNGGYANNWLVGDLNRNEIADLELGLKNVTLRRSNDGYFVGTNFPVNEKLLRDETDFDPADMSASANARRVRGEQLVEENKGRVDLAFAKKYLSDHYDSFDKKEQADERTLCGHIDLSPRGLKPWQPEFGPAGTAQAKAADAALIAGMSFDAAFGHPCGIHYKAARHLGEHTEFAWMAPLMRDLDSHSWARFTARH